jgi:hypothetical protein
MITRTEVDLRENFGSSQLIKKNIDSGKRIFVLDGDCFERSVIHTHLKLPSFFLTKRAGQPQGEDSGEYNPYLTAPRVDFSVQLISWVAYDKVFRKWVQYPVGVQLQTQHLCLAAYQATHQERHPDTHILLEFHQEGDNGHIGTRICIVLER